MVADSGYTRHHVLEQRQRVGAGAAHETACPVGEPARGIEGLRHRQRPEIDSILA
jgi:hypothetical protein